MKSRSNPRFYKWLCLINSLSQYFRDWSFGRYFRWIFTNNFHSKYTNFFSISLSVVISHLCNPLDTYCDSTALTLCMSFYKRLYRRRTSNVSGSLIVPRGRWKTFRCDNGLYLIFFPLDIWGVHNCSIKSGSTSELKIETIRSLFDSDNEEVGIEKSAIY